MIGTRGGATIEMVQEAGEGTTSSLAGGGTVDRRTYRVCCDCGAAFDYSIEKMAINRSELHVHVVEDMRHAAA